MTPRSRARLRANTTGTDLAQPRQDREDFRKALVNLIMYVEVLNMLPLQVQCMNYTLATSLTI